MSNISIDENEVSDISDSETIFSESEISEDESMNTSDEEFIDDSDISTEDESDSSDEEYVPPYKRFVNENEEKVEIKFENGEWVLKCNK